MLKSLDWTYLEGLLSSTPGQIELALAVACFVAGWLADRALPGARDRNEDRLTLPGGLVRVVMPLTALVLLIVVRALFRRYHAPVFLDIAIALAVALAFIRIAIYTLRRFLPNATWLKTWERWVSFTIWTLLVLYLLGITHEIATELDQVRLPIGRTEITLLTIVKAVVAIVLTLTITLWVSGMLEQRLMKTGLDSNLKVVLAKSLRALLLLVGLLIALQAIGFDLTLLAVFGGALGVGIGLGLQKLAANYIAGFTILLDRSVRMGDMVTVDNRTGVISKLTSRYVVVRGLDGTEAIVPNETLVTSTVLNHSYSSSVIRVGIPISVSYDSDVDRALALMVEAARAEPRSLSVPPNDPAAFLAGFGDNGINLEMSVWIADPENGQLNLRSAINRRILEAFGANGIRIPFPQREVRQVGALPPAGGAEELRR